MTCGVVITEKVSRAKDVRRGRIARRDRSRCGRAPGRLVRARRRQPGMLSALRVEVMRLVLRRPFLRDQLKPTTAIPPRESGLATHNRLYTGRIHKKHR